MYDVNHDLKTAQYGPGAEIRRVPVNTISAGSPGRQPVADRIEDLASQVAITGRELTEARDEYQRAALVREQTTKRFISVTEALFQAIQEHREGTPEGVPYQPR